ncbi:MAG: IS1096 element passenger TnpR family protein [Sulfuricurvum sp.]
MFKHIYKFEKIFQFYIILSDVTPPLYRTMQISEESTFWDLHIAIQDAFGWSDSHLHEFCATAGYSEIGQSERIGYPDEDAHRIIFENHKDTNEIQTSTNSIG